MMPPLPIQKKKVEKSRCTFKHRERFIVSSGKEGLNSWLLSSGRIFPILKSVDRVGRTAEGKGTNVKEGPCMTLAESAQAVPFAI